MAIKDLTNLIKRLKAQLSDPEVSEILKEQRKEDYKTLSFLLENGNIVGGEDEEEYLKQIIEVTKNTTSANLYQTRFHTNVELLKNSVEETYELFQPPKIPTEELNNNKCCEDL